MFIYTFCDKGTALDFVRNGFEANESVIDDGSTMIRYGRLFFNMPLPPDETFFKSECILRIDFPRSKLHHFFVHKKTKKFEGKEIMVWLIHPVFANYSGSEKLDQKVA